METRSPDGTDTALKADASQVSSTTKIASRVPQLCGVFYTGLYQGQIQAPFKVHFQGHYQKKKIDVSRHITSVRPCEI